MADPIGTTITNNYGVILQIDDTIINTAFSSKMGGGYVRQMGGLVENCNIGDFVQYDASKEFLFKQGDYTFSFLDSRDIMFIQTALP